jgi:hypothetical protein
MDLGSVTSDDTDTDDNSGGDATRWDQQRAG